jgi:hypothetical protein
MTGAGHRVCVAVMLCSPERCAATVDSVGLPRLLVSHGCRRQPSKGPTPNLLSAAPTFFRGAGCVSRETGRCAKVARLPVVTGNTALRVHAQAEGWRMARWIDAVPRFRCCLAASMTGWQDRLPSRCRLASRACSQPSLARVSAHWGAGLLARWGAGPLGPTGRRAAWPTAGCQRRGAGVARRPGSSGRSAPHQTTFGRYCSRTSGIPVVRRRAASMAVHHESAVVPR